MRIHYSLSRLALTLLFLFGIQAAPPTQTRGIDWVVPKSTSDEETYETLVALQSTVSKPTRASLVLLVFLDEGVEGPETRIGHGCSLPTNEAEGAPGLCRVQERGQLAKLISQQHAEAQGTPKLRIVSNSA